MKLNYVAMPVGEAERLRQGGPDAYGDQPERRISDGDGVPCRHCLRNVDEGQPYLVLAYRPFSSVQAYAETGPIFMHAENCAIHDGDALPPILASSKSYLLRGYGEMSASSMARAGPLMPSTSSSGPWNCWHGRTSPSCMFARENTTATSAASKRPEREPGA